MIEVPVYHLTLIGPPGRPSAVEFSVLVNAGHASLSLSEHAVQMRRPLAVRVTVPPGCRIVGLQKYEGEEIMLVPC